MNWFRLFCLLALVLIAHWLFNAIQSAGLPFTIGVGAATVFWIAVGRLQYGLWLGEAPPTGWTPPPPTSPQADQPEPQQLPDVDERPEWVRAACPRPSAPKRSRSP